MVKSGIRWKDLHAPPAYTIPDAGTAQAEQPGGVVNLAIGENNAANRCAAQTFFLFSSGVWAICWLISGEVLAQHPLFAVIAADDDRRLGARGRLNGTVAQTLTVGAVTVPLGKPPPAAEPRTFINMKMGQVVKQNARTDGGQSD